MNKKLVGMAAACAAAVLSSAATAAVTTTTFKGTVSSGYDDLGLFGTTGANLAGDPFTAVFTINDAIPHQGFVSPSETEIYGGPGTGNPAPSPVSAILTINGQSFSIAGSYAGEDYQCACGQNGLADSAEDSFFNGTSGPINSINLQDFSTTNQIVASGDYHTPFTHLAEVGDNDSGSSFMIEDLSIYGPPSAPVLADFSITSVTTSGVPEPVTWAMLLAGFGGLGAALRSGRRNQNRRVPSLSAYG